MEEIQGGGLVCIAAHYVQYGMLADIAIKDPAIALSSESLGQRFTRYTMPVMSLGNIIVLVHVAIKLLLGISWLLAVWHVHSSLLMWLWERDSFPYCLVDTTFKCASILLVGNSAFCNRGIFK